MALLHIRRIERRRTLRVALTVPLYVHGNAEGLGTFHVRTHTVWISGFGAIFPMSPMVGAEEPLLLLHGISGQKAECRVASIQRERDGKTYFGVEFASLASDFWHGTFPPPGAKPLRRLLPVKLAL